MSIENTLARIEENQNAMKADLLALIRELAAVRTITGMLLAEWRGKPIEGVELRVGQFTPAQAELPLALGDGSAAKKNPGRRSREWAIARGYPNGGTAFSAAEDTKLRRDWRNGQRSVAWYSAQYGRSPSSVKSRLIYLLGEAIKVKLVA